jgi:ketosteroid isomerase-like protein
VKTLTGLEKKNEEAIRHVYAVAETKDSKGFMSLFTPDGVFYDVSAGKKYTGKELGLTVDIYGRAFPDMHRELYSIYVTGDTVVVELALQGTHKGPLALPAGTIPATGNKIDAPCCDVFQLKDGKVVSFNCHTAGTVLLGQLGVLGNLGASFVK